MGKEKEHETVTGCKDLCISLGIHSKSGNHDAERKRFQRLSKKYNLPVKRNGNRIYMLKSDIEKIKEYYLLGYDNITKYLGLHIKTFRKWLKQFPKMPIDRTTKTAYIPELDVWYACLVFDRLQKGRPAERLTNRIAPIREGIKKVFFLQKHYGLSTPRELKLWVKRPTD